MADALRALLRGQIPVAVVPDGLTLDQCERLCSEFETSPATKRRDDGVDGLCMGAYHYGKEVDEYHAEIARSASSLSALLAAAGDPVSRVLAVVREAVQSHPVDVRPARWGGRAASLARIVSWSASGDYVLKPHEDIGQLTDPRQRGFEVQEVVANPVIAVNMYLRIPARGGALRLWNVMPDDECRRRCGTTHTGHPYDSKLLGDHAHIDLDVEEGWIVLMNGGLVHAVTGHEREAVGGGRVLLNFFLGLLDPNTVLHWV